MMGYARLVVLGLAICLAGCGTTPEVGEGFNAIPTPDHQYTGLAGQSIAVMVWTDWQTRTEYSRIQLDLARATQTRLEQIYVKGDPKKDEKKADAKKEESPAVEFINPASVVRFQRERPETEGQPIVKIAPRLGVTRVVYVEVENLDAHAPQSIMLLKGSAKATLRVVEVAPDGTATVAFEESGISVNYPPNAPEGVIPDDKRTVRTIYEGTIARLAEAIGVRFAAAK